MSDPTQELPTVCEHFDDGTLTLYGRPFQGRLSMVTQSDIGVLQPPKINFWVWAVAGSLATTTAISFDFCSPATEMFQFAEYTSRCRFWYRERLMMFK